MLERKPEEINEIFEEKVIEDGSLPDPSSTDSAEFQCAWQLLRGSIQAEKTEYARMAQKCRGVLEETTTGVHRSKEMDEKAGLLFLTINESDYVTKLKFDDIYGCWYSLFDGVMCDMDAMIGGKRDLVCDHDDVRKGSTFTTRGAGVRALISETDPICALQVCTEGLVTGERAPTLTATSTCIYEGGGGRVGDHGPGD
jgi:adenosylhomocysteinase